MSELRVSRDREREREISLVKHFLLPPSVPPTFIRTPPESSEGTIGEHFQLTCEASGRPTPTIFWSKTSTRILELGDPLIRDPGNGSLIFERLQSNHSGLYLCEIEGSRSMTSRTLLTVSMASEEFTGIGELIKKLLPLVDAKHTRTFPGSFPCFTLKSGRG